MRRTDESIVYVQPTEDELANIQNLTKTLTEIKHYMLLHRNLFLQQDPEALEFLEEVKYHINSSMDIINLNLNLNKQNICTPLANLNECLNDIINLNPFEKSSNLDATDTKDIDYDGEYNKNMIELTAVIKQFNILNTTQDNKENTSLDVEKYIEATESLNATINKINDMVTADNVSEAQRKPLSAAELKEFLALNDENGEDATKKSPRP